MSESLFFLKPCASCRYGKQTKVRHFGTRLGRVQISLCVAAAKTALSWASEASILGSAIYENYHIGYDKIA